MRVLMTADAIGGVWNYTVELCQALAAKRVLVSVAVLGRHPSEEQRAQLAHLPGVDVHASSFRLEWMHEPWDDLDKAADWLLRLEGDFDADIVHLNHLMHADLPWRAPVLSVGHSCVLSWWEATQGPHRPLPAEWSTYRAKVTASLRAARCVVAPTQTLLNQLQRFYGPLRRCEAVQNARSAHLFRCAPKEPLVLSAGRFWDPAKNIAGLAAAAAQIRAPVAVAGEMDPPDNSDSSAPPGNLRILGRLAAPALADWYSRAAIYALPARYEPFGLTALEAALSGCALVLGDIPSLREVWGDAARFVAPDDTDSLATAVNELLADQSAREQLAARAMSRALRLRPVRQGDKYLALYRRLQRETPRRRARQQRTTQVLES